jgi:hypothetical protein
MVSRDQSTLRMPDLIYATVSDSFASTVCSLFFALEVVICHSSNVLDGRRLSQRADRSDNLRKQLMPPYVSLRCRPRTHYISMERAIRCQAKAVGIATCASEILTSDVLPLSGLATLATYHTHHCAIILPSKVRRIRKLQFRRDDASVCLTVHEHLVTRPKNLLLVIPHALAQKDTSSAAEGQIPTHAYFCETCSSSRSNPPIIAPKCHRDTTFAQSTPLSGVSSFR